MSIGYRDECVDCGRRAAVAGQPPECPCAGEAEEWWSYGYAMALA